MLRAEVRANHRHKARHRCFLNQAEQGTILQYPWEGEGSWTIQADSGGSHERLYHNTKQHQTVRQTDSLAVGGRVRKYHFQVNTQELTKGIFSEKAMILSIMRFMPMFVTLWYQCFVSFGQDMTHDQFIYSYLSSFAESVITLTPGFTRKKTHHCKKCLITDERGGWILP